MSDRYHRQRLVESLGDAGQESLAESRVTIVGTGALGCGVADLLARAGVGSLTLIDRDIVEETNLQRQVLFDEDDAVQHRPKAAAAAARLEEINSHIAITHHVEDLTPRNAEQLLMGTDLIVDGLDNFETRYLLNDISVAHGIPFLFGGVVAAQGNTMTILPSHNQVREAWDTRVRWTSEQSTPCLRCLFPQPPPPGTHDTCDTAGVLGPAVAIVCACQAMDAIKLLAGHIKSVRRALLVFDMWRSESNRMGTSSPDEACPCCGTGNFEFLDDATVAQPTALCGQDAVQIPASGNVALDLPRLKDKLTPHGHFEDNAYLVRGMLEQEQLELLCFRDGRVVVHGTSDINRARAIHARYVGV
ncbi:MAG: ThiF family adenylyltransferase [Phycisphaerales bacterium]|nr:ThiF family adenylyltransferase [Phycisphaerales bacterium]